MRVSLDSVYYTHGRKKLDYLKGGDINNQFNGLN